MAEVDSPNNGAIEKAAKRRKPNINLQKGKHLRMPEAAKPTKSARRRQRRFENKPLTKDEKERRIISVITHKKAATSCNWQNFIASKPLNETVTKPVPDNVKEAGFQKALARKKRKAGLHSDILQTSQPIAPEVIVPPLSPDSNALLETPEQNRTGAKLTSHVALDCEMVGVNDGKENMLARVSLVNKYGDCIYDKFVYPKEEVIDYRTHVSGVRPEDLENGESFEIVNKEVGEILKGRILVGHAVHNDLKVLHLPHPKRNIRDTAKFPKFRQICGGRLAGLKKLAAAVLGIQIQQGEHDSVIDARATMQLYMMYRKEWEEGRKWRSKKIQQEKE